MCAVKGAGTCGEKGECTCSLVRMRVEAEGGFVRGGECQRVIGEIVAYSNCEVSGCERLNRWQVAAMFWVYPAKAMEDEHGCGQMVPVNDADGSEQMFAVGFRRCA